MRYIALALALFAMPVFAQSEADYNARFCAEIQGEQETRHYYKYNGGTSWVATDCETNTRVFEGGLDKRSSLDSVQQALFYASLTGKMPAVVIYDTDGKDGVYEHRIRAACMQAGIFFQQYRWSEQ